jgi:hypothetical protein
MSLTALFKLKQDADPKRIQKWQRLAKGMVGQVPGKKVRGQDGPLTVAK